MSPINQNNPLGRHSGAGRNPAIKNTPRSGQNNGVVPLTWELVNQLDTGLRRYDAVSSNGLFGINPQPHNFTKGISACRTQLLGGTCMVECQEKTACQWSVPLGDFKFCEHPTARQIFHSTRL